MGGEVAAYNRIYNDGMKAGAVTGVPHWLTPPNGFWCTIDVM
jgi:hypothetical protein